MKQTAFPLVLIVVGVLWLLVATDLAPATSTLIALALAGVGVTQLVLEGFNKNTLVAGPMWMLAGGLVYAVMHRLIGLSVAGATATIVLGLLMLLARLPAVPEPPRAGPDLRKAPRNEPADGR